MLRVGIPKEIKSLEKRVGLTPSAVKALCEGGIKVTVQQNAGLASGFPDEAYCQAGAQIAAHAQALYAQADLIQKVKEPLAPEFDLLRKGRILFGFLHLVSPENGPLVQALIRSGVTAIGYETVEKDGRLPLLAPMSEIAGALAAAYAAVLKPFVIFPLPQPSPQEKGDRSKDLSPFSYPDPTETFGDDMRSLLEAAASKYPDFKGLPSPGRVVIFGGGVAGFKALETALRLKGEVTVIEKDSARREFLKRFTPSLFSPDENFEEALKTADVLIGSVHARGKRAFHVLTLEMLTEACRTKKKVMMDIAIDQGGNFPESHATPYADPVYFDSWGNLRFCVPNIPSLCGRGASEALSRVTLVYTQALARDPEQAFRQFPELVPAIKKGKKDF